MDDYTSKNAFLELGSTSIKFYLVAASGENAGEVEHEEKIPWQLGYDVFEHQRISPRSISHCLSTLRKLAQSFPEVPLEAVTAVGTAAMREAQNAELFQRVLWDELRVKIHIIEGGIEAFLLETGFRSMVEIYPTGLFDLGGGSLELIEYLSAASTRKTSVPVGAVRLHSQLRRARDLFEYIGNGRKVARRTLIEHLIGKPPVYPELIGTGGTVRAIVQCVGSEEFGVEDVQRLIQQEVHGPVWSQLKPHRRNLFLPGLLAVEALFTTLGAERILQRQASVKQGLVSFTRILPSGP